MINGETVVACTQVVRHRLTLETLAHYRRGEIEEAERKMVQRDELARWILRTIGTRDKHAGTEPCGACDRERRGA